MAGNYHKVDRLSIFSKLLIVLYYVMGCHNCHFMAWLPLSCILLSLCCFCIQKTTETNGKSTTWMGDAYQTRHQHATNDHTFPIAAIQQIKTVIQHHAMEHHHRLFLKHASNIILEQKLVFKKQNVKVQHAL